MCTAQPLCRGHQCGWVPCRDCRCSRAAPVGVLLGFQPTQEARLAALHRPQHARPTPATTSAIQTARAICGTRTGFASAAQCAATAAPAVAVLSNLTKRRQRRWQPSSRSISLRSTLNLRARRDQNSKKLRLGGTAGTASCSIACHSQERRCAGCTKPGRGSAERGPFGQRSSSPRKRGPMQVRSTCCCAAGPSCSHACVGEGVCVMQILAPLCISPPGRHVSLTFAIFLSPHTHTQARTAPGLARASCTRPTKWPETLRSRIHCKQQAGLGKPLRLASIQFNRKIKKTGLNTKISTTLERLARMHEERGRMRH